MWDNSFASLPNHGLNLLSVCSTLDFCEPALTEPIQHGSIGHSGNLIFSVLWVLEVCLEEEEEEEDLATREILLENENKAILRIA